jgi:hypothetical protein
MYFAHWMNLNLEGKHPPLSNAHAQWIFGLLTQVEDHLSGDDMCTLRNLVRACIQLLRTLTPEDGVSKDKDAPMSKAACWIVISVVVERWAQRDLWEDAVLALKPMEVA